MDARCLHERRKRHARASLNVLWKICCLSRNHAALHQMSTRRKYPARKISSKEQHLSLAVLKSRPDDVPAGVTSKDRDSRLPGRSHGKHTSDHGRIRAVREVQPARSRNELLRPQRAEEFAQNCASGTGWQNDKRAAVSRVLHHHSLGLFGVLAQMRVLGPVLPCLRIRQKQNVIAFEILQRRVIRVDEFEVVMIKCP